jgi:hypothetical protein
MNRHDLRRVLRAGLLLLVVGTATGAHAGLFRAYLSSSGSDSNPCTVDQPCRLLPAALAAVNDGGEIWMQNSANFNTSKVTITKSVTILAIPGALASIVANGEDAIYINAPGVKVALRNLNLIKLAGTFYGVRMMQGSALTVEGCEFYGLDTGIHVESAASVMNVSVRNTVIRDSTFAAGLVWGPVRATFDRAQLLNSVRGILVDNGATVTVANSAITNNSQYGIAVTAGGSGSEIPIANSIVNNNGNGIWAHCDASPCTAHASLQHNTINGNQVGVNLSGVFNATVFAVLDDNAIVRNTTGVLTTTFVTAYTRSNNTIENNTTDLTGPAMTARSGR